MKKEKMDFDLSFATYSDVDDIQKLIEPYHKESRYSGLTYDPIMTRHTITQWIPETCVLARVDGKAVGVFAMYFFRTYHKEPEADVVLFYIDPEYRGTGVSRLLVNALTMIADKKNVAVIYVSSGSGISHENDKMFSNLFGKFGFEKLGTELVRKNG